MEIKSETSHKKLIPLKKNHWSHGLIKSLSDPELKVYEDDLVTVIKDIYPKAEYHYLVCPKADIASLKNVKTEHITLLKHMSKTAEKLTEKYVGKRFLIGYHAIPSMIRLHLHVISDDFNSKYLKTKKHWNSFNTDFFLPSEYVIQKMESGKFKHLTGNKGKELLNMKLKCHKCEYYPKNMPDLKIHIAKHC